MLVSDFGSWQKGVEKQSVEIVKFTFIAFWNLRGIKIECIKFILYLMYCF